MGAVEALILDLKFPCTMAKSVLAKGNLIVENFSYGNTTAIELRAKLERFDHDTKGNSNLSSFIAEFSKDDLIEPNFQEFESFFWDLLSKLRTMEIDQGDYDNSVSLNPDDKDFGFSVGGSAYFLILLHPENPRQSRRSSKPAIVFNLHRQFTHLRKMGIFDKMKRIIRGRDKKLQGSENPMMKDFGNSPEWLQYTGREMQATSKCPFKKLLNLK